MEIRTFRGDTPDELEGKLSGRAAPFNSWTVIGGDKWGFRERIAPGAFAKSLKERDIVLLDNHDMSKPLARTSAKTLTLKEKRDSGLHFEATPNDTTYAIDAMKNVRDKNYGGMSFGFEVVKDSWKRGERGAPDERTLEEVRLFEISCVTMPAYKDTDVNARADMAAAWESRKAQLGDDVTDDERADSKKPYGNVAYADPKNGKYPIDTKEHAKAAWSYINMPKNAAKYPLNGVSLASVKAKIKTALKKFGVKVSDDEKKSERTAKMYGAFEQGYLRMGLDGFECFELLSEILQDADLSDEHREYVEILLDETSGKRFDEYDDDFYEREDEADTEESDDDSDEDRADSHTCTDPCATCKEKYGKRSENSDSTEGQESEPDNSTRSDESRREALRKLRNAPKPPNDDS